MGLFCCSKIELLREFREQFRDVVFQVVAFNFLGDEARGFACGYVVFSVVQVEAFGGVDSA